MAKGQPPEVVVWTKSGCPACVNAKRLLDSKKVKYQEKKLGSSPSMQKAFAIATKGAKSIPQVFINGEHIGGFDDLQNLQKRGELNYKLGLVSELPKRSIADKIKQVLGFN
jgi:glutaredoxin 3